MHFYSFSLFHFEIGYYLWYLMFESNNTRYIELLRPVSILAYHYRNDPTYRFFILFWLGQNSFQPQPLLLRFMVLAARQRTGHAAGWRILGHPSRVIAITQPIVVAARTAIMVAVVIVVIIKFRCIAKSAGSLPHRCQMAIGMFAIVLAHKIRVQCDYSQSTLFLFNRIVSAYWRKWAKKEWEKHEKWINLVLFNILLSSICVKS